MHAFRNWRWNALAVAFGLTAPVAQAGMITPDSISNSPSAVASSNGTPVYRSSFVTSQYKGVGLNVTSGGAITNLNGVNVWVPTQMLGQPGSSSVGGPPGNYPVAQVNYNSILSGGFVSPGSLNPTTLSSLTVETLGNPSLSMSVYGLNGQRLTITPSIGSSAGVQEWTFTGPGISSFSVAADTPGFGHPATASNPAWGVAGVSFTPASAPEPSSLVLAGLGALGIATRLGWRRSRRIA